MEERRVGISFAGGAWASLGYSFLLLALSLLVLPAAWGATAFLLWWTANLVFDDGTRAGFEGRAGAVWVLFAALILVSLLPSLATSGMPREGRTTLLNLLLILLIVPFEAALKLPIYRWIIGNIRLEPGGYPRFVGAYPAYLGWSLLLVVSYCTVIGWAWVAVAMLRWFCRNIEADGYGVAFAGTGWGLLWRSGVWLVGMLFLVPLPWVLRSMYAWWAGNLVLLRRDVQGEFGSALA